MISNFNKVCAIVESQNFLINYHNEMISFQIVETINPLIDDEVTWLFFTKSDKYMF